MSAQSVISEVSVQPSFPPTYFHVYVPRAYEGQYADIERSLQHVPGVYLASNPTYSDHFTVAMANDYFVNEHTAGHLRDAVHLVIGINEFHEADVSFKTKRPKFSWRNWFSLETNRRHKDTVLLDRLRSAGFKRADFKHNGYNISVLAPFGWNRQHVRATVVGILNDFYAGKPAPEPFRTTYVPERHLPSFIEIYTNHQFEGEEAQEAVRSIKQIAGLDDNVFFGDGGYNLHFRMANGFFDPATAAVEAEQRLKLFMATRP